MTMLTTPGNGGEGGNPEEGGWGGGGGKGMFCQRLERYVDTLIALPLLYGSVFLRIVIGGRPSVHAHIWILSSQLLRAAPRCNKKQLCKTGFN